MGNGGLITVSNCYTDVSKNSVCVHTVSGWSVYCSYVNFAHRAYNNSRCNNTFTADPVNPECPSPCVFDGTKCSDVCSDGLVPVSGSCAPACSFWYPFRSVVNGLLVSNCDHPCVHDASLGASVCLAEYCYEGPSDANPGGLSDEDSSLLERICRQPNCTERNITTCALANCFYDSFEQKCVDHCLPNHYNEDTDSHQCVLKDCEERSFNNSSSSFPCATAPCYYDEGEKKCITGCVEDSAHTGVVSSGICKLKECNERTVNGSADVKGGFPCGSSMCYAPESGSDVCGETCADPSNYAGNSAVGRCVQLKCEDYGHNAELCSARSDCHYRKSSAKGCETMAVYKKRNTIIAIVVSVLGGLAAIAIIIIIANYVCWCYRKMKVKKQNRWSNSSSSGSRSNEVISVHKQVVETVKPVAETMNQVVETVKPVVVTKKPAAEEERERGEGREKERERKEERKKEEGEREKKEEGEREKRGEREREKRGERERQKGRDSNSIFLAEYSSSSSISESAGQETQVPFLEKVVRGYTLKELIGVGSFGEVYRCTKNGKEYAAKRIPRSKVTQEIEFNFADSISAKLNSEFLVKYYESFETPEGEVYIIMQLCQKGDLGMLISSIKQGGKSAVLDSMRIVKILIQLVLGLDTLHESKFLHRDLKPANIFTDPNDNVKIGDFGCARKLDTTVGMAYTMAGTPLYISPEMVENKPYTSSSDMWSLGVILYELCTLERPFAADSILSLARLITKGEYKAIPKYRCPGEVRQIVDSLLQVVPEDRLTARQILQIPFIQEAARDFDLLKYFPPGATSK